MENKEDCERIVQQINSIMRGTQNENEKVNNIFNLLKQFSSKKYCLQIEVIKPTRQKELLNHEKFTYKPTSKSPLTNDLKLKFLPQFQNNSVLVMNKAKSSSVFSSSPDKNSESRVPTGASRFQNENLKTNNVNQGQGLSNKSKIISSSKRTHEDFLETDSVSSKKIEYNIQNRQQYMKNNQEFGTQGGVRDTIRNENFNQDKFQRALYQNIVYINNSKGNVFNNKFKPRNDYKDPSNLH